MTADTALRPASTGTAAANVVALRTREWYGDRLEEFAFPEGWEVAVQEMQGHANPPLSLEEIAAAMGAPVGTPPLREIAAGKKTAAIAVDDMTRPTPTHEIVPHVLAELHAAGIEERNILFVVAHGSHCQINGVEAALKLGEETVRRHPWINHNAWENLVDLGTTSAGNRVEVNAYYHKADVRVTISGLKAHVVAGYGGGPKAVLPGLSGIRTIRFMHEEVKRAPRPSVGPDRVPIIRLWENENRRDMIEAAHLAGIDFSVQVVHNQERRPVCVVSGEVVKAHHLAARFAVGHYATPLAYGADVVVVNAYPRATQFYDRFAFGAQVVKPGGSVVIVAQHPMGLFPWHYWNEGRYRGEEGYFARRDGRKRQYPQVGQILVYSSYLQTRDLEAPNVPPEAIGVRHWDEVVERLRQAHPGQARVAAYPYAGIQHGIARLDLPDGE